MSYDLVAYPSKAFPQCHPDRLALIGHLFGLHAVSVNKCRVLEIGCGDGLNLIAAAQTLSDSHFRGIDLSQAAIARGNQMIRELGLRNVVLEVRDFQELPRSRTRYDYVIAHGLYSWLPQNVREALLPVIASSLRPNGIAFVSYNAYPGAYLRQMVREMAGMSAGRDTKGVQEWLRAAPANLANAPAVYRSVVADEAADMLRREDGALFHDDLTPTNQPVYFRDFMAQAIRHGLQYVAEAELGMTVFGPDLLTAKDRISLEQQADFRRGRRFRETLLCNARRQISRGPDAHALASCFIGAPVIAGGAEQTDGSFEYVNRVGKRYKTANTQERFVLESLAMRWPRYLPAKQFGKAMEVPILNLLSAGVVDARTFPPSVAEKISLRPKVSDLARLQAGTGTAITTLHGYEVQIEDDSLRMLMQLADGTRTRKQLHQESGQASFDTVHRYLDELLSYGLILPTKSNQRYTL